MAASLVSLPPLESPFSKGMGGQNFLKCKSDPPHSPSCYSPWSLSSSSQLPFPSSAPDTTHPILALDPSELGTHPPQVLQLCGCYASQDSLVLLVNTGPMGLSPKVSLPRGLPDLPGRSKPGTLLPGTLCSHSFLFFEPKISLFCTVLGEWTFPYLFLYIQHRARHTAGAHAC